MLRFLPRCQRFSRWLATTTPSLRKLVLAATAGMVLPVVALAGTFTVFGPESFEARDRAGNSTPASRSVRLETAANGPLYPGPKFAAGPTWPPGSGPTSLAVGDLNADGIPDLVTANFNSNDVAPQLVTVTVTAPKLSHRISRRSLMTNCRVPLVVTVRLRALPTANGAPVLPTRATRRLIGCPDSGKQSASGRPGHGPLTICVLRPSGPTAPTESPQTPAAEKLTVVPAVTGIPESCHQPLPSTV